VPGGGVEKFWDKILAFSIWYLSSTQCNDPQSSM